VSERRGMSEIRRAPAGDDFEVRRDAVVTAGGRVGINEYGTPISLHTCSTCGEEFTVCPPALEATFGSNCLDPECPSYDPARDAEVYFLPDDPALIERSAQ
jgi:hypothetical protein